MSPDYDDSDWPEILPNIPLDMDNLTVIGLVLQGVAGKAHVYLNGVLIARDWSVCAQRKFYLPEGLLDLHGENVLALVLWRRGEAPSAGEVRLEAYGEWRAS